MLAAPRFGRWHPRSLVSKFFRFWRWDGSIIPITDGVVALAGVKDTVCGDAGDRLVRRDLVKQISQHPRVADLAPGELDGPHLQRFLVNLKVNLVPNTPFAAVKDHLSQLDRFWEKEQTKADIEVFVLDESYANLPSPPFTAEEKVEVAAEVYSHVWQQAISGDFAKAA